MVVSSNLRGWEVQQPQQGVALYGVDVRTSSVCHQPWPTQLYNERKVAFLLM